MKTMFIEEINEFEKATLNTINNCAKRWLNVAYKLDYITLSQKEKIDDLLRKHYEMSNLGVIHKIYKSDVKLISDIKRVVLSTRFSPAQLKAAE